MKKHLNNPEISSAYNFVYRTTNLINNKVYIGVHRTNDLDDGYLGSGTLLKKSVNKYGEENFKKEILKFFETYQEALDYERELVTLDFINEDNNYNLKEGGYGSCGFSEETKKQFSITRKKMFEDPVFYARMLERNQNEERRKKISVALTGKKMSEDHINKVNRNPIKIQHMATKHRGMKRSTAAKQNMSNAGKGKRMGKDSGWFCGWYITPYGKFDRVEDIAKKLNLSESTIHNRCKYINEKKVNPSQVGRCKDLDSSMIGKTWKELGWGFEEVEQKKQKIGKFDTLKLNGKYEVLTSEGFKDFEGILTSTNVTIKFIFDDDSILECTPKHKIFIEGVKTKYKLARSLKIGEVCFTKSGTKKIKSIEHLKDYKKVYELFEVSDNHEYYTNDTLSHQCLALDEYAFVNVNMQKEFMSSVLPTISSGKSSKIIVMSTPNGIEMFYNMWMSAVRGESNYYPIKIMWSDVPGRDEAWKQDIIKSLPDGLNQFNVEFGCRFLGSANTLIDADKLEKFKFKPYEIVKWNGLMKIWEEPIAGKKYVIGVDTASGGGNQSSNYSVIQVLKINSIKDVEQVAIYRCKTITPYDYAPVVIDISNYYNDASAMIENNADVGGILITMLWNEYEFDRIINIDSKYLGIRASVLTKREGNMLLKRYLENNWLVLNDKDTIHELSIYEETSLNCFRAANKQCDDCVTSLVWALFYLKTNDFLYSNIYVEEENQKNIEKNYEIMSIFE